MHILQKELGLFHTSYLIQLNLFRHIVKFIYYNNDYIYYILFIDYINRPYIILMNLEGIQYERYILLEYKRNRTNHDIREFMPVRISTLVRRYPTVRARGWNVRKEWHNTLVKAGIYYPPGYVLSNTVIYSVISQLGSYFTNLEKNS